MFHFGKCATVLLCGGVLAGCQTIKALEAQHLNNTYEVSENRILDEAPKHQLSKIEYNLFMKVLDDVHYRENGREVGINVAQRVLEKNKKISNIKRGLSPVDLHRAELNNENIAELTGSGAERIKQYLKSITDRLLDAWPYEQPEPEVSFLLVDHPLYNAKMTPYNLMVVNVGVLLNVESEDELAAILAHELSHSLLRHHNSKDWKLIEEKVFTVATGVASGYVSQQTGSTEAVWGWYFAQRASRNYNNDVLFPHWDRHLEDYSDMLAVDLLVDAGYDWIEVTTMLERLVSQNEAVARASAPTLTQEERALTAEVGQESGNEQNQKPLQDVLSLVSIFTKDPSAAPDDNKQVQTHPAAADRLVNAKYYIQKHYRRKWGPDLSVKSYRSVIWSGEGFALLKKQAFLKLAEDALGEENYDKATQSALEALGSASDPDPRARIVLYRARKKQGKRSLAVKNLEIARQGGGATKIVYEALIEEYESQKKWGKSLNVFLEMNSRFPMDSFIVYYRSIRLSALAGKVDMAKQLKAACIEKFDDKHAIACENSFREGMGMPPLEETPQEAASKKEKRGKTPET